MNKNKKMNLQRFAEGNYIGSKDASALIPEQVSEQIMQSAIQNSVVLQLGRKLQNMTSNRTSMPVLDMLPVAYFVSGEPGVKKTTTLVLGGEDNTQGVLQILDSSGAVIGSWDEAGLNAKKGKIGNLEITEDGFKADDNERIFLQVIDGGVKIYAAPREGEPSKGSFIRITKYGVQIESYGEIDFTCIGAGTMNLTGDIYVNGKELKV